MNTTAASLNQAGSRDDLDHSGRALVLLWLALAFFLLSTAVGLGWDRRWHTTHVFDSFYSPPHLFIYTMLALTLATVGG